jgi:hypothetical protein
MTCTADSQVSIQTSPQSVPSTPDWFGEVTVIAHYLRHLGKLTQHLVDICDSYPLH